MRRPASMSRFATVVREPGPAQKVGVPLALALLLVLYLTVLWPWMLVWGSDADLRTRALPGDELVPDATDQSTRVVVVHAPADSVWPWLVQIGEDRAGFYSYTWLENLFGADIHNADRVDRRWQTLQAGDLVRAVPDDYLGGVLPEPGWRVAAIEPGRWFVLRGWGTFLVEPVDATSSRVVVRTRYRDETWWGPVVTRLAFGPAHFVMERRMLLGIRDRAEGRRTPWLATVLATFGFALAAIGAARALLRRPHPAVRLAAPTLLLAAVVGATGDPIAGAAGFIALGLVLLGLPYLRRRWPVLVPIPAAVLLVLLLVPDAFLAFGFLFLACTLAVPAGRTLLGRRASSSRDTAATALRARHGWVR